MYEMRKVYEVLAFEWAVERITPEELEAKWQNSFSHRLGVWSLEHTPNGWPK